MIEIINTQGLTLDLDPESVVTIERNNSLFNDDGKLIQDITYPGSAGLTPNNIAFIGGAHLVESAVSVYEFPVQLIISGYLFYAALFSAKINAGKIEYTLKVNLGAIASKMKTANLSDIYSLDPISGITTDAQMAAHMLATCKNPQDYPCVFFPVYDEIWYDRRQDTTTKWVNEYDLATQSFKVVSGIRNPVPVAPFYRMTYIVEKILKYLNFNLAGDFFTDPEMQEIYIFTRIAVMNNRIAQSLDFMPAMLINDFIKLISARFKVTFLFNLASSTVTVLTTKGLLQDPHCLDISEYMQSIDEHYTAEQKGYTVTLEVNQSDRAQNIGTEEKTNFDPPFALIIGNAENKIELQGGTLAQKDDTNYSYPITEQEFHYGIGKRQIVQWPIVFLRYKGMKRLPDGKYFPQADPVNITQDDAIWYQFLNDAKHVTISAKIPPHVLMQMDTATKLAAIDQYGTSFTALPVKITYQVQSETTERIPVTIEARTMIADYNTKAWVKDQRPVVIETRSMQSFKAYYDPYIHGFQTLRVERVPLNGSIAKFDHTPIEKPTDHAGVGGSVGNTWVISGTGSQVASSEYRLYATTAPQYYIADGVKGTFTAKDEYFVFSETPSPATFTGKPTWIVF